MPLTVTAAVQVYKQTVEFVYLGGAISANRDLSVVLNPESMGVLRAV